MIAAKKRITYVTSSDFKEEEIQVFVERCKLSDDVPVTDRFEFEIRKVSIPETLEVDLEAMVRAEVTKAYGKIRVPCIVEHAGLVFDAYKDRSYPGGLTKAMWNTLGDDFIHETNSAGRKVVARAVVGYCDGKAVYTFVGETPGKLAEKATGSRKFYWDTIFIPTTCSAETGGKTYAEIVDDENLGLAYKVEHLSQGRDCHAPPSDGGLVESLLFSLDAVFDEVVPLAV